VRDHGGTRNDILHTAATATLSGAFGVVRFL
jgi:hypothetical protein